MMKRLCFCIVLVIFSNVSSQAIPMMTRITPGIPSNLKDEAATSIKKGVEFLLSKRLPNGSWMNNVAMTSLALISIKQSGIVKADSEVLTQGRKFIVANANPDGTIIETGSKYVNYSTAIALCALAELSNPKDVDVMRKARAYLIDSQLDEDNAKNPTSKSNPFYGGIGYGSGDPTRPDLSNTQWALEALYLTDHLDDEANGGNPKDAKKSKLAWKNALKFLSAVQNVPESADNMWVVNAQQNPALDGGFIYKPGDSKVNSKLKLSKDASLRSYGSMTYAGLKSMIYARLKRNDYRVKAALEWAKNHYTLTENPGMGAEGHYYYLQTFAKALSANGYDVLTDSKGHAHNWRVDLIKQLHSTQRENGEWVNDNGRWMESVPELATCYSLIAMEIALAKK